MTQGIPAGTVVVAVEVGTILVTVEVGTILVTEIHAMTVDAVVKTGVIEVKVRIKMVGKPKLVVA
jgi:hypothetical protein